MSELFGYLLIDKHLFVWLHVLFGIAWIGLLYYFNFIQGGYFKAASPEALADAKAKLAPEALWWFRWAAMFTFLTGLILLHLIQQQLNNYIAISALMGTLMFLNVWLIIWPNQKVALGLVEEMVHQLHQKLFLLHEQIHTFLCTDALWNVRFFPLRLC